MAGTYSEYLGPGKLNIGPKEWSIDYYWPGPDLRYRGTSFSIKGKDIDEYIDAWKTNFSEYRKLIDEVPSGGQFEKGGAKGMVIRIGGHWPGVSLRSHHFQIKTADQLEKVITDYEYARSKAEAIQAALFS